MSTLLFVDDEPSILACFREAFRGTDITFETAKLGEEALEKAIRLRPDLMILDLDLPDISGLEVFKRLRQFDTKIPVIFVTGRGSTDTVVEAMKQGAFEYLLKPLGIDIVREVVGRAMEVSRLMRVPALVPEVQEPSTESDVLVGRSEKMQEVYKAIGRVAPQDLTVLILGESGTGKELIARAIYHYSRRSDKPFLAINCAAITETLLESELFGHEKGAFTGADRKHVGKFEQCNGGTIFLDEIGDMTPMTQAKILRVLQDQKFERVGGSQPVQTDVRVIAATNRNLEQMTAEGRFRDDLFYRLNVFTISLPPLRERLEDLSALADHFLSRFRRELGKEVHAIAPETMSLLRQHQWPGNVREFQSVLKQAVLRAMGPVLLPEFLPELHEKRSHASPSRATEVERLLEQFVVERMESATQSLLSDWQTLTESHLIAAVLRRTGGNISQASRVLGLSRQTLRNKMESLKITPPGNPGQR